MSRNKNKEEKNKVVTDKMNVLIIFLDMVNSFKLKLSHTDDDTRVF